MQRNEISKGETFTDGVAFVVSTNQESDGISRTLSRSIGLSILFFVYPRLTNVLMCKLAAGLSMI